MADEPKSPTDQVGEIKKLVQDAEDKLDQVNRALRTLEDRLKRERDGDSTG